MKLVEDTTFIMDSMNLWFLRTFHYSPSPSPVGAINAASRRSFPTFNSTCLRHFVLLLSSLLFPLVSILTWPLVLVLTGFVFLSVRAPSPFGALYLCWYRLISCFFFFFFFFLLRGDFSSCGWSTVLVQLQSAPIDHPSEFCAPAKSFNCTTPPSVTVFTSYGPNQCILSFPGC
jgi:hypothetical protein